MELTLGKAIGLGFLQGIAEFLPISSSGHLALLESFWGLTEIPRLFDVMLHLGTLAAVVAYYRRPLLGTATLALGRPLADRSESFLPREATTNDARRLIVWVIIATMPAVAAGLLFRPTPPSRPDAAVAITLPGDPTGQSTLPLVHEPTRSIDERPERDPELDPTPDPRGDATVTVPAASNYSWNGWRHWVGDLREQASAYPRVVLTFLGITGLVLAMSGWLIFMPGSRGSEAMTWRDAVAIGLAQALSAVCPGLSRSGMTVSVGLTRRLRPDWAVHFSLLMSLPAVLGAAVLKFRDADTSFLTPSNMTATMAGAVVAGVVGFGCIHWLLRAVRRQRWGWFGVYLWLLVAIVWPQVR